MELKFENCFGDARLQKRAIKMTRELFSKSIHSIRQISSDYASQRGWYRFLGNKKTTEQSIIKEITKQCFLSVKGRVVLSIQDTSEINLYNHKNRIQIDDSIGTTTSSDFGLGFFVHPSFVVDAQCGFPIGFSDIKVWNRSNEKTTKYDRKYKKLPIEQKESYKWIESSIKSKESLAEATTVIIVQDREGDIYDQFAIVPDTKTHLLIRSKSDRMLAEGIKLSDKLAACEVAGTYSINMPGDKRKKQTKRTAILEVRFCPIKLKRPGSASKNLKSEIELYSVEAKEINAESDQIINWKILTTLPVTTIEEALCILEWYSWRWIIEEIFKILKEEGYNIEASELESARSIKKLSLLMLATITKLLQMRYCYSIPEGETLESIMCFTEEQQECLEHQCAALEGKTEKLKNPYPINSLARATWVIARLGGWKGYKSERSPGITTLWMGLRRFYDIYEGWALSKDVYSP
jgi:hypothetical protein